MKHRTFIRGKDAALEDSISSMQQKLSAIGIEVEEASWLNPVPHVYSVHIRDKNCGLMFTNGKGASDKACLASALGEYFERLSCNYFFADFYLGKSISRSTFVHYPDEQWIDPNRDDFRQIVLNDALWAFYDPYAQLEPEKLFDINSGCGERGICCLPFQRLGDQHSSLIPVNIIANCYVSNGMSAGNTANEARVQALSEIFERHVKNRIISEGISLPSIPASVIARYPPIQQAVTALENQGFHLKLSDASLGGRYPVIAVTLINPTNASAYASFGAHPSFEVALERTVTELLQGRSLEQLDGFQSPSLDLDEVADPHNLETHFIDSSGLIHYRFFQSSSDFEFNDWDFDADTGSEFETLSQIIHDEGFQIYIADYQHLGVYSCRILVPGMSEIYPVEDLLENNNNEGATYRKALLTLDQLSSEDLMALYENINEAGYNDFQSVCEFIGIAPDPNTAWAELRIGELKAMLCLAVGHEDAPQWIDWCLHLDQLSESRQLLYQCIDTVLLMEEQEISALEPALKQLFTPEIFDRSRKIVTGEITFSGLHFPGLELDGFENHQRLLAAYLKLQLKKQQHHET